jgi:hypothetical protein
MFGIRGFFAKFGDVLKNKFNWLTDPAKREKAAKAVATTLNLIELAAPYVKLMTKLTPTTTDDIVIAAVERVGISLEEIIAEPDWHRKVGLIQDLAGEALRAKIKALLPTFDHGLDIAGTIIHTAEELDALSSNAFHAPVVLAVNALRAAGELSSALKGTSAMPQ